MKLSDLLTDIEYVLVQGNLDIDINNIVYDSRKAQKDDVFVCIKGTGVDGHKFIPQTIEKGVTALIVTDEVKAPENITVVKVNDDRKALAYMSAAYFGYPANKLKTIGIHLSNPPIRLFCRAIFPGRCIWKKPKKIYCFWIHCREIKSYSKAIMIFGGKAQPKCGIF